MPAFKRFGFAAIALSVALAGCNVTSTGGGGTTTVSSGTDNQLRASVRGPLRRAGVSEECINSLDTNELTQVRTIIPRSTGNSREWIQRNQRLRTFVSRYCPDL